ncbi:hypothetical protein HEP87_60730 [Streptomyces sp. S1D4-11]|nr:hypothetical protein [Streptomyces sp. S1D4-11]
MSQRPLGTALALATAAVASVSPTAVPARTAAADGPLDPKVPAELATAYTATAKYLDESVAIADGYVPASSSGRSGSFRTPTGS